MAKALADPMGSHIHGAFFLEDIESMRRAGAFRSADVYVTSVLMEAVIKQFGSKEAAEVAYLAEYKISINLIETKPMPTTRSKTNW